MSSGEDWPALDECTDPPLEPPAADRLERDSCGDRSKSIIFGGWKSLSFTEAALVGAVGTWGCNDWRRRFISAISEDREATVFDSKFFVFGKDFFLVGGAPAAADVQRF